MTWSFTDTNGAWGGGTADPAQAQTPSPVQGCRLHGLEVLTKQMFCDAQTHVWVSGGWGPHSRLLRDLLSLELLKDIARTDVIGQRCSRPPTPRVKDPRSFEAHSSGTTIPHTPAAGIGGRCSLALKDTQVSLLPLPRYLTVGEKLSQKARPPDTSSVEQARTYAARGTGRTPPGL